MKTACFRPLTLALLGGCLPVTVFAAAASTEQQLTQASPPAKAAGQAIRFAVKSYVVDGTPQLDKAEIDAALSWLPGPKRSMADLQVAQQALQTAYHHKGLDSVYVLLPEQEVTDGIVRFSVAQGKVRKVTVTGNKVFSEANVRRAMSTLQEGKPLEATKLSENIQLANENPARQLEVSLAVERGIGEIDAKVKVTDEPPLRFFTTLDNTGNDATGQHRLGVAVQHANLFDRDHTASFAYTTSPDSPSGVKVNIYSLGYRIPFYAIGDSLEAVYGHSNVDIPSGTPALGGVLGMTGKGDVLSLRWNHYLPSRGEYSSHVTASVDGQDVGQDCSGLSGGKVAGCVSYRTRPVSLAYIGKLNQVSRAFDFELTLRANAGGSSSNVLTQAAGRPVPHDFKLIRGVATLEQALPADWLLRLNAQLQLTNTPLPASEKMGLAGATDVRGFAERAVATDQGAIIKTEIYTPSLGHIPGDLRLLAFYDYARGHDYGVNSGSGNTRDFILSSAGCGLRYQYLKNVFWRADFAQAQHSYAKQPRGRMHFTVTIAY